jgi:hypothetical protein
MDAAGAAELRKRLADQAHWRQAQAVRDGRQPAVDPDVRELAELGEDVRFYACDEHWVRNGHSTLVRVRMVKRLIDGWWQTSFENVPSTRQ